MCLHNHYNMIIFTKGSGDAPSQNLYSTTRVAGVFSSFGNQRNNNIRNVVNENSLNDIENVHIYTKELRR